MNSHSVLKPVQAGIGLTTTAKSAVLGLLDHVLADEYVLYTKTRNFHWNVTGMHFSAMHKFFEEQYEQLDGIVDEVAERSRAIGGRALGSMKEFLGKARLQESTDKVMKEESMIAELLADHESLVRTLRRDIEECDRLGDQGTSDFLTGVLKTHEKTAWMLRSSVG